LKEQWNLTSSKREFKSYLNEHCQDASATIELNSSMKENWQYADAQTAEVLLPEDFPVEAKRSNS